MQALRRFRRGAHGRRSGAALIISLITVTTIAGLGATLIQMQSVTSRKHAFSIDRRCVLYVAEAGIAEAALAVSQGKSGILASEAVPARFGRGVYWVETSDLPDDRIALVCTARVGTAEFMLRTVVVPNLNPVASLGFFGADGVEVGWGTVADGFHSGRGEFAELADPLLPVPSTGGGLKLGSNADIVLVETLTGLATPPLREMPPDPPGNDPTGTGDVGAGDPVDGGDTGWGSLVMSAGSGAGDVFEPAPEAHGPLASLTGEPTRLYGRLRPGPKGSVRSSGFSELTGRMTPARYPVGLPAVIIPSVAETLYGNQVASGTQTSIGLDVETDVAGDVLVPAGATLRLVGPTVLVADRLLVANGGRLEFDDDGGPIQVYLRSGLDLAPGSEIDSVGLDRNARGTSIFLAEVPGGAAGRVELAASGRFHGILYAPSDSVTLPASIRWFGSAVARLLRTEPGAHVSVDRRLGIGGDGVPTLPRILSWQIVPIGEGTARELRVEPLLELTLRGVTPIASSAAAPETVVEIQYVSIAGTQATYVGPFTGFDSTTVRRIVGVRWDDPRGGPPRAWLRPTGEDPTGSIPAERISEREVRAVIRRLTGDLRVGNLTQSEAIDLISSLPSEALAAESPLVKAVDERTGGGLLRNVADSLATFDLDAWLTKVTGKDDYGADDAGNDG